MTTATTLFSLKTTKPIFLIGFMGSGKTYWGSRLANQLHRKFIDLDQFIENNEQQSIQQIFEKNGEDYFREKEALALRTVIVENNILISCGGGAPCFYDNMNFMNQTGLTIYLEASPKFLFNNIIKEPQARPLLKNMNEPEMLFFIEQKLAERKDFYEQAGMILNGEELNDDYISKLNNK